MIIDTSYYMQLECFIVYTNEYTVISHSQMITDIVPVVWSKTEEDNEKWCHYYVWKEEFKANNIMLIMHTYTRK